MSRAKANGLPARVLALSVAQIGPHQYLVVASGGEGQGAERSPQRFWIKLQGARGRAESAAMLLRHGPRCAGPLSPESFPPRKLFG